MSGCKSAAMLAALSLAAPLFAATVSFGPLEGAELSVEKLSPIDDFLNGEIGVGRIPSAVVLIQCHGQPVYLQCFGKRDVDNGTPATADTKFFLTDPVERARYAQPLAKDRHVERNSLDVTRWEPGGGGMVSTIADFARYGQMFLNGGKLDGKTYLSPATFATMTTDHIGGGSGVARNYFYYPGDGFGFGYGFGVRTDPGNAVPPPGSLGEIKWDGATGVYLVVDRTEDS